MIIVKFVQRHNGLKYRGATNYQICVLSRTISNSCMYHSKRELPSALMVFSGVRRNTASDRTVPDVRCGRSGAVFVGPVFCSRGQWALVNWSRDSADKYNVIRLTSLESANRRSLWLTQLQWLHSQPSFND